MCKTTQKSFLIAKVDRLKLAGGSLGGHRVGLGGPWKSLGAPWERVGRPEMTQQNIGAHFVRSGVAFGV